MNGIRSAVRDERGIAVVIALITLLTLSALVLAFLGMSFFEPQISRNMMEATQARYVAEAALEVAYDTLVSNTNWAGLVAGSAAACGGVTSNDASTSLTGNVIGNTNSALPGSTTASGRYTVRVRNDCRNNDALLTGVTREANDTEANDHVILTATATYGNATRTMSVVVTRVGNLFSPESPPRAQLNAALSFPGYESDTRFTGNSFLVDGRNHDLSGNVLSGNALLGISVGPEDQFVPSGGPVMQHENSIQNSLSAAQKDNVTGKHESGATTTIGDNTIDAAALTSQAVTDFVNAIKGSADITINSTQASPASFNNVGSTCAGNYSSTSCWGTSAQPKIVYIKGAIDTTSAFNALSVSGNSSGFGILIVEDGDFTINGNFAWEGPIIVTGGYVGVGINGGGNQTVRGALISNETATNEAPGFYEGVLQGNAKVEYSKAAIDKALA
ncbi:MAG TPA: pilus assembly PilX N-terminal domain-containing protein, partial [Terriglobales bacterium]|nr:pilus assembly PilX N-terminal domain-containing protein [Terriglobales bacterium]